MRFLIDALYFVAALAVSPVVLYRRIRYGRYRTGWGQKLGAVARRYPQKKCIWLHAVSVGEVNAAQTLVAQMEKQFADFEIVISTTTDTGFARAEKLFGQTRAVFYFPFDFSCVTRRAFRRLNPSICLLMELEVWPNFVFTAHERGVPVLVLNGRISDRSFSRYRRIKGLTRRFFGKLNLVLAQTQEYAQRFRELGCPADRVIVTSSLKYDTAQVADAVEGADALAAKLNLAGGRLWVAGGTGHDEEKIILDVYRSLVQEEQFNDVRLAVVPRKPERFNEVAQLIEQAGFPLVRYSQLKNSAGPGAVSGKPVILGDTMGDLRKFYSLATVIFVGRSLVPMGGSDMMEAVALGKCTVFGPHTFNFRQTVEALVDGGGAILVADGNDLLAQMRKCLSEPQYAAKIARAGQAVIRQNQGATAKTMEALAKLLCTQQRTGGSCKEWTKIMTQRQNTPHADLSRRYDVDWLRVLGMMVVFLFHNNRFFDTEGWHVKSAETSEASMAVTIFAVQWMMPLFFILSGIGIYHALSHQGWPQYLLSRVKRLLVPLLFGIFVVIAPLQVYLERITHKQFEGSFWSFYPHYFEGWFGLGGNFAWMGVHLWYLEFLFVFSIITLPLFLYLRSPSGSRLASALTRLLSRPWTIFLLALPIGLIEFISVLPPIRDGIFGRKDFGGWSALPYLTLLILGYLLATDEGLAKTMERHRGRALVIGVVSYVLAYFALKGGRQWPLLPRELFMSFLRGILCWSCLVAFFGFASRHLRFSNPFLKYANEAVLPFYILHQVVILCVGFYVLRLHTHLWLEYLIITSISFAVIMALYELLIRRANLLRILFGMKAVPRGVRAPAPHPVPSA